MNRDDYDEVVNGQSTYQDIADQLSVQKPVIIGWTPENGSHFDVMFVVQPKFLSRNIQGGIQEDYLFVTLMRLGAFAFEMIDRGGELFPSYIGEKLNVSGSDADKLTELIRGVMIAYLEI